MCGPSSLRAAGLGAGLPPLRCRACLRSVPLASRQDPPCPPPPPPPPLTLLAGAWRPGLGQGDRSGGHQAPERPVWIMETLTLGGAASAQKSRFLPLGERQGSLNLSLDPGTEKPTARFCFRP